MMENIVFLTAAYLAAIAATLAGFGSSTLLIPVAAFFMDVKTAVVLVAFFHFFNNLFKVQLFFRKIDFSLFGFFGIPSILFAFWGSRIVADISTDLLQKILGLFFIFFASVSLWSPDWKIAKSSGTAMAGGSCSGFLAGLLGVGGAVRAAFLMGFDMPKQIFIATSALIAFVVDLTRIPIYLWEDVAQDKSQFVLIPFLFITAFLGVKSGKILLEEINQKVFRKIVFAAILLIGIKFLLT